jgi:acyl-CoA thioesterase 8
VKARGRISPAGGHEAHLSAIAYMSDSYFIGTVARVHKLWRYSTQRKKAAKSSIDEDVLKTLLEMDDAELKRQKFVDQADIKRIQRIKNGEDPSKDADALPEIGMMVSLDHTIYFHNPRTFRADEWIFTETETPWAGDGRGLVFQRMYTKDGTLIATCVQEVRISLLKHLVRHANLIRALFDSSRTTASCEDVVMFLVPLFVFSATRLYRLISFIDSLIRLDQTVRHPTCFLHAFP